MENEDARYQTLEQLHERRKQAVRMHLKGIKIMKIDNLSGLCYQAVRGTIDRFKAGGWSAMRPARRGRETGEGRLLSDEQGQKIKRAIIDKRPEQMKLGFYLGGRSAAAQLVVQEFGLELSERTVGSYLKRWGLTPQKPVKKAYGRRPEAVQAWLDEHDPAIVAKAKAEDGEIHWGDETAPSNTDARGRGYAPAGKAPVSYAPGGEREKLPMIATVTNQGKTRWMVVDDSFNADKLIEFLGALVKDTDKKVPLILDNLRVHHAKPVKAWLAERTDKTEVSYLPSHSPELNPEERLNADLKLTVGKRVPVRTKAKLRAATEQHRFNLSQNPQRVRSFFQDKHVKYAA